MTAAESPWKINLSIDERYPFVCESPGGLPVPTTADQATRWREVMEQFEVVQSEMEAAYDAAREADMKRQKLAAAEASVARAQARLEQARYDAEHPPEDPLSWPSPGDYSCQGTRYADYQAAARGRLEFYDAVLARGARPTFDVAPFTCVDGHIHLGRTT